MESNYMWKKCIDFSDKFLIKDEKKFNEDFSNFIKQNNFDQEQINYFKLMLKEVLSFRITLAHLHYDCNGVKKNV